MNSVSPGMGGKPCSRQRWLAALINSFELFAAAMAATLVIVLALFFQKTRVGRALRAVADDHAAALSVGISLRGIWVIVWAVAGLVALVEQCAALPARDRGAILGGDPFHFGPMSRFPVARIA